MLIEGTERAKEIPVDENSDTREVPTGGTPWDQPPPAEGQRSSDWGSPPPPATLLNESKPGPKPKPKRRSRVAMIVIAGLLFSALGGLVALVMVVMHYTRLAAGGSGALGNMVQYTVEERKGKGKDRILQVRVDGIIFSGKGSADVAYAQLRQLRKKKQPADIKVVLLRINSPGGAVTPCDKIDNEIQLLKAQGMKFVAFYDELAASGGYYVSARSDHIVARPTCTVGSVGVVTWHLDMEKLLTDKLGIKQEIVASGESKASRTMFKPLSDKDRKLIQKRIDELYERFVKIVSEGRRLTIEEVKVFADGRVFGPEEAKKFKMIDEIGHWDAAIAAARKFAPGAEIIGYRRRPSPLEAIFQSKSSPMIPEEIHWRLKLAAQHRFCYLWAP
jgi:protease IV